MPNPPPRSDFRPSPVRGKYGLPGSEIPWLNPTDLIITENVPIRDPSYKPLPPGTPHPRNANAILVREQCGKSNGNESSVDRIYATRLTGQDSLNAVHNYEAELSGYPTFIRTYFVPLADYEAGKYPQTKLQPLDSILRIIIVEPGSGYTENPAVTIDAPTEVLTMQAASLFGVSVNPLQMPSIGVSAVTLGSFTGTGYLYIDATSGPAEGTLYLDPEGINDIEDESASGSTITFTNGNPSLTVSGWTASIISQYSFEAAIQATAAAQAMNGAVAAIWVTTSGTGYVNRSGHYPNVSIAAPPAGGTQALAVAIMQPANALLVAEKTDRIDEPSLQDIAPYFVKVTQVYQTLPGPVLQSFTYNERGELQTTITQTVAATATVDSDGLLVDKASLDIKGPTADRTLSTVASRVVLTEKSIGYERAISGKWREAIEQDTANTLVVPSTALTPIGGGVIAAKIVPKTAVQSEQQITTLGSSRPTLTGAQYSRSTWGQPTAIVENFVADGTAPATGINVLESTVDTTGTGYSEERTILLTSGWGSLTAKHLGGLDIYPSLWKYSIEANTVKTKVAPSSALPSLSSTLIEAVQIPETVDCSELQVTTLSASPVGNSFQGFELNSKGQSVVITKSIVPDGTGPTLSATLIGSDVVPLGNGDSEETDRNIPSLLTDTLLSYRQTGASAGAVMEATIKTFYDATATPASDGYPNTAANVISDELVESTLQSSIRITKKLTLTDGSDYIPSGTPPVYPPYTYLLRFDEEIKWPVKRSVQFCNVSTVSIPALNSAWMTTGIVIDVRVVPTGEAPYHNVNGILEVDWVPWPIAPIVDFIERGYEFPAIFTFDPNFIISSNAPYYAGFPPPWPGTGAINTDTFCLVAHRSVTRPMRRTRTFSQGPSNNFQTAFKVITPGVSSRLFQIPANCIHQPVQVYGNVAGVSYLIENIPASYPASYSTQSILTVAQDERPVLGRIFENTLIEASEDLLPSQFGPVFANLPFVATGQPVIQQQPDPAGEYLWLQSSNAGDTTQVATLYGRHGATAIKERVTLTGTTFVRTNSRWSHLAHLHLSATCAGTITLYGSGTPAAGLLEFTGQPNDGETVTIQGTGASQTYTFKTTIATSPPANEVQIGATPQADALNLALAINTTGSAGTTATNCNYSSATVPTAGIVATIDATDGGLIHLADNALFQANSQTYTLSTTSAAITVTAFTGSADGPVIAAISPGGFDAYNNVFFNASGLLDNGTSVALAIVPGTFGNVQEGTPVISASTDGTPSIPDNLPATTPNPLISNWINVPVPADGSGNYDFTLVVCLASTPSLSIGYDLSADGSTVAASPTLQNVGNGKVFRFPVSTIYPWVRFKINNPYPAGRAIYAAVQYEVQT